MIPSKRGSCGVWMVTKMTSDLRTISSIEVTSMRVSASSSAAPASRNAIRRVRTASRGPSAGSCATTLCPLASIASATGSPSLPNPANPICTRGVSNLSVSGT